MKKKVAVSTWCTENFKDFLGIDELTKSISYFHPEIDHHVNYSLISEDEYLNMPPMGEAAERGYGHYNCAPSCLEIVDDYDMVIHIDGDAVVVGELNELIGSNADIVGTLNNNALGKAGAHEGLTTEKLVYSPRTNSYESTGNMIPIDSWLNMGVFASNKKEFWEVWHQLNMSICKCLKDHNLRRLPSPYGDENETANVVFYSGRFSYEVIDRYETNLSYNLTNIWGDSQFQHWDSWKLLYIKDNKVFLNNPINGIPMQVKILHQAGGFAGNEISRKYGGFRNWLRQAVSPEVSEFIDHISK